MVYNIYKNSLGLHSSVVAVSVSFRYDDVELRSAFIFNGARRSAVGFRHCATSRKVAGSIPDGVTGIFH